MTLIETDKADEQFPPQWVHGADDPTTIYAEPTWCGLKKYLVPHCTHNPADVTCPECLAARSKAKGEQA